MLKLILLIFLIANIIAFVLMGLDKRKAITQSRRISEATLFLFGALGGIGGTFGMFYYHHKTKHLSFRILFPVFALCQIAVILWLCSK